MPTRASPSAWRLCLTLCEAERQRERVRPVLPLPAAETPSQLRRDPRPLGGATGGRQRGYSSHRSNMPPKALVRYSLSVCVCARACVRVCVDARRKSVNWMQMGLQIIIFSTCLGNVSGTMSQSRMRFTSAASVTRLCSRFPSNPDHAPVRLLRSGRGEPQHLSGCTLVLFRVPF